MTHRRLVAALALLALTTACADRRGQPAATPISFVTEAPAAAGTPLPLAPLTAASGAPAGGGGGAPALPAFSLDAATVLDVSVSGDPTRYVLPKAPAAGPRPALVFLHGHGMDQTQLTTRTALAQAAVAEGWIAASGDLTGRAHWGNDGALRAVGALVQDLVANRGADPARIYLVGFSMGGGTALLAAGNPLALPYRVAAVASTQGFSDLRAMTTEAANGGGFLRSIADAYGGQPTGEDYATHSPKFQAARLAGLPVYLEHGEADNVVPPDHTRWMAAALQAAGAAPTVSFYAGKGHDEGTIGTDAIMNFLRGKRATP